MKKTIAALLCLMLLCTAAFADVLTIDLSAATDEELAAAAEAIRAEQLARIETQIVFDQQEVHIAKGKNVKIEAVIVGLPEGEKEPKLVWASADESIATVSGGRITAVAPGSTQVICSCTLSDGIEISSYCTVTVYVPVKSLNAQESKLTIGVGNSVTAQIEIKPDDATDKSLAYASSDPTVATVDENGCVTAVAPGKCEITVSSLDGSEKTEDFDVVVPSVSVEKDSYTVVNKEGMEFYVSYYGADPSNVKFSTSGSTYADVVTEYDEYADEFIVSIIPLKAGKMTITVSDGNESANKIKIEVIIDNNAVYDTTSYPKISYEEAARYPDSYEGKNVSFSGKVLQVIKDDEMTQYRISSKGNYDNVVYVAIFNEDITVPLLEDDKVTVYGAYRGNLTYETVMGAEITIPMVLAERIDVK